MAKDKVKPITLRGTIYWAHIVKPEQYEGKDTGYYSVLVELESEEKTNKLKSFLEDFWEENKPEGKLSPKAELNLSVKETPDGNEAFKAKTKAYDEDDNGTKVKRKIPIFKGDGTPMEAGTLIGNGSKVQINVTPSAYRTSTTNYGVTLFLNAIQVDDLIPYGVKDAAGYGFEKTADPVDTDAEDLADVEF